MAGKRGWIVEERIRVIQRGVPLRGKWRDGRRVVDRECIGERPTQEQCEVEGSCSKPRPVRLADFMTTADVKEGKTAAG